MMLCGAASLFLQICVQILRLSVLLIVYIVKRQPNNMVLRNSIFNQIPLKQIEQQK